MKQEEVIYKASNGTLVNTNIIRETYATNDEWKENRCKGIGASEVPSVIGINEYQSLFDWWQIRKGLKPAPESNESMERGHFMEDAVAQYFEYKSGLKVHKNSAGNDVYYHKDFPWRRVTPDRIGDLSRRTFDFSKRFLLECKTYRGYISDNNYPRKWRAQLMYQLGVTGCRVGYIAWIDSDLILGYDKIEFNQDEFDSICSAVDAAWHYCIEGDVEPDPVTASDYKQKYPAHTPEKSIEMSGELQSSIEHIQLLDEQIKGLKEERERLADTVKMAMTDAEFATDPAGVVLCTYKASKTFDEQRLLQEHSDLYVKYQKLTEPVFDKEAFKKGEGSKMYAEYCTIPGSRSLRFPREKK